MPNKLTRRQQQIVNLRAKNRSMAEIGRKLNISKQRVHQVLQNVPPQLREALERNGCGLDESLTNLKGLMRATKTEFAAFEGKFCDEREVSDNRTRLAATTRMLELQGAITRGQGALNVTNQPTVMLITGMTEQRVQALRRGNRPETMPQTISIEAHEPADENPPEANVIEAAKETREPTPDHLAERNGKDARRLSPADFNGPNLTNRH